MGGDDHADGTRVEPGWFQSIMLRICEGSKRVRHFVDDIDCFEKNGGKHLRDLQKRFDRLTTFNMNLGPRKAHVGVRVVKVLGHSVTAEGIAPDPRKVEALMQSPMTTNVGQLRSTLLGLSYYRKFLKGMAAATKYLNSML